MRNLICAMLAFFLVQCATLSQGPMQRILISSEPTGASVHLSGCGVGSSRSAKTPARVLVNRSATLCNLTFTLPEYGSRTVPLFRRWSPALDKNAKLVGRVCDDCNSPGDVVAAGVFGGIAFGIDRLTGAMFEQSRSTILVDFNKPLPNIAGRYSLVAVNGKELPATTWTSEDGNCQIWTNSGSVVLKENGRWSSTVTEQQICGKEKRSPAERTAHGVVTLGDEEIVLESFWGVSSAVLQGDRLEVTGGVGLDLRDGQTAVYTLRLSE